MTLLEQLRKPEEVKRWFDQIGDQAANEIESLQQQLTAARQSKNACVIDLYRRLDLLDDLNQDLLTQLATVTGERENLVERCIRDDEWKAEAMKLPVQLQHEIAQLKAQLVEAKQQAAVGVRKVQQRLSEYGVVDFGDWLEATAKALEAHDE